MKKILFYIMVLFYAASIKPQGNSYESAVITASLVKGLSTEVLNGNLNFGDYILSGTSSILSRKPSQGIILKVNGQPDKNVIFSYAAPQLRNSTWCIQNGGAEGVLSFQPVVEQTSSNVNYQNAVRVVSGNSYQLTNVNGEGLMYLWIGGSLSINDNQPQGDYTGSLLVSVSY